MAKCLDLAGFVQAAHIRSTFRKGRTDSWKEEIPMGLQERMDFELKHLLERWGYK